MGKAKLLKFPSYKNKTIGDVVDRMYRDSRKTQEEAFKQELIDHPGKFMECDECYFMKKQGFICPPEDGCAYYEEK